MRKLVLVFIGLIAISYNVVAAEFEKKQFFSTALNKDQTYFVSLPDGYNQADTTKKFPVLIFLHGASVTAQDIVTQFEAILGNPFSRILFQKVFKTIFIIPDGSSAPYLGSFYTNSELYGNFEDYISVDLLNEISKNYNTINHRERWAIMGHSMGGFGATKIALKNPDKFIGFASLSGPLHTTYYNDILPMVLAEHGNAAPYDFNYQGDVTKLIYSMAGAFSPDKSANPPIKFPILPDGTINQEVAALWNVHNPINLIGDWKGNPKMAVFLYCGEADEYKLAPQNRLFSDSLTHYNIQHKLVLDPSGDHVMSLISSFPQGLNFLVGVMDTAKINTPVSTDRKPIAREFIYPNPVQEDLFFSSENYDDIDKIAIVSLSGSILNYFSANEIRRSIPVQNLNVGCYLLKVDYRNGQTSTFRFTKTD